MVRDLGLAVGGLLDPEMGGPSIQPPLPASLLDRPEFKSERLMAPSRGAARYRRGVYVNVQRTFPYPMLKDFDAADPSAPCPRRERSNTPLQALTLLNDPAFAEFARRSGSAWSASAAGRDGSDPQALPDRARGVPRIATRRDPLAVYEDHRALYASDSAAAAELLGGDRCRPDRPGGGGRLGRRRADGAQPRRVHHPGIS